ncbi:DUF2218 domain-containing protein [Ornithinimicrobium pekingense]|uniref:DUF2218 domain-containing protein n=1 Tax=Ornithinimicrobium pekingense TaxID=384677 RepID=A0ABQ2F808_9MICO|nr:DUF2218 domain-containing protein [Ornithinimicrobium pekingense]GGK70435.1 hypothetical protein GCM10011509_18600 [Ornithinimicrobium pekingense]
MTDVPTTSSTARTALVQTPTPGRWAKQLASHLGRPGKMSVEPTSAGPRLSMTFDGVETACLMDTSAPDVLALHATAGDEAALDRMTQVVGSHLERFGEKAGLQVVWA